MLGDSNVSVEKQKDWVWEQVRKVHPEVKRENFPMDDPYMFLEIVARDCYQFHAKPNDVVMDIGANIGVFTALCALNGAMVVAYEPHPEAFALLLEMMDRNKLGDLILPVNCCLWTEAGECSYQAGVTRPSSDHPQMSWTSFNGNIYSKNEGRARAVTLADALARRPEWDCVKMDIEGAEFAILEQVPEESLQRIKFLTLELHNGWADKPRHDAMVDKLARVFHIDGIREGDPVFAGQHRWQAIFGTRK